MIAVVRKNSWRKLPNDGNHCAGRKALVVDVVNRTSHSIQDLLQNPRARPIKARRSSGPDCGPCRLIHYLRLFLQHLDSRIHVRHFHLAENGGEGGVRGILPGGDAHHLGKWRELGSVEENPAPAQKDLEDCVEIRRRVGIPSVTGDKARRYTW
jgi:hypothetical protein